uniref:U30-Sparatoxin-Hju1a_1 n=1 Tax=Heteropoda jugulans TaxID=1358901 RepID=A0A4Q8K1S1_9ARAC
MKSFITLCFVLLLLYTVVDAQRCRRNADCEGNQCCQMRMCQNRGAEGDPCMRRRTCPCQEGLECNNEERICINPDSTTTTTTVTTPDESA